MTDVRVINARGNAIGLTKRMTRRACMLSAASSLVLAAVWGITRRANGGSLPRSEQDVPIEDFSSSGQSMGTRFVPKIIKSDTEWRRQLPGEAFIVTRHAGTERPFSGAYWNVHAEGLYRCICCDTALFDSATKFESGTGWPSFWQPIAKANVVESVDQSFGMTRTAVSCRRCDAHLGHVFDDGPQPTGLRYCMNSVSLHFVSRA
jgi:peptide-methionine (R)-S-oxide reductase